MIVCEGLTKCFGAVTAIEGFTVEIPEGRIFGLLGPNGAGKTTTIRLLSCLLRPTAGDAWIDDLDIRNNTDSQRIRERIGLLPEIPGLYETLGSYKNLDFYAQLYGVPKAIREDMIKTTLTNLGLWERRNEPVGGFSKGMKQKIAIARALVHKPKYLFLDEPTASLDPEASKIVRDYILELKTHGDTIILNTHNLTEAERICDTVAVVKNRVVKIGNPKELARRLFARTIRITVDHIPHSLIDEIHSVTGVADVEAVENHLLVKVKNPEEENHLLIAWLIKKGVHIQFISEEEHSLEDVYLKLIGEGDQ